MTNTSTDASEVKKFIIPDGARRVLVSLNHDGSERIQVVADNADVLNIERDLLLHLNDYPHSDAWLAQLRDYCAARLDARAEVRGTGRIVAPSRNGTWEMMEATA